VGFFLNTLGYFRALRKSRKSGPAERLSSSHQKFSSIELYVKNHDSLQYIFAFMLYLVCYILQLFSRYSFTQMSTYLPLVTVNFSPSAFNA
jgi:hypothetical protein